MKKLIIAFVFTLFTTLSFSQTPPPPNNDNTGSGGTTPVGGGAPITGGLGILVSMGLAYGYAQFRRVQSLPAGKAGSKWSK